jgi:hypothetical protein
MRPLYDILNQIQIPIKVFINKMINDLITTKNVKSSNLRKKIFTRNIPNSMDIIDNIPQWEF